MQWPTRALLKFTTTALQRRRSKYKTADRMRGIQVESEAVGPDVDALVGTRLYVPTHQAFDNPCHIRVQPRHAFKMIHRLVKALDVRCGRAGCR